MNPNDSRKFSLLALSIALFATISCGTPPSTEVPEHIKTLASSGISADGGVVGSSLSEAWCKELKTTPHSFSVYELSLKINGEKAPYDSLINTLVKQYVGDSPDEKDTPMFHAFTKKFGKTEKRLTYGKKYGEVSFYTNYNGDPLPKSSSVISKEILFKKVKDFVSKYVSPDNANLPYIVSNYDVEEGEDGGASRSYIINLEFVGDSVAFSSDFLTNVNFTRAYFRFNANGDLDLFEFVPGTFSKSSSTGNITVITAEKALEKAKTDSNLRDMTNVEVSCRFDFVAVVSTDTSDEKIYFIPAYLFYFRHTDNSRRPTSSQILAAEDSALSSNFRLDIPDDTQPDSRK